MRKLFTLFLLLPAAVSYAATWVVSNVPGFPGHFTNLQTCINAAANGDIIVVQGSGTGYGPIEINKQLIIMGPGYFLNQNPETQAIASAAMVDYINCTAGASGSIIQGLEVVSNMAINADTYPNGITWIGNASINVENCGVTFISINTLATGQWVHLRNSNGSSFSKCYGTGIYCSNNVSGLVLENCIFNYGCYLRNTTVKNCFFDLDFSNNDGYGFSNCNIINSILGSAGGGFWNWSSTFNNNIFLYGNPLGLNAGNNITGEDPANLFVGVPSQGSYSDDAKFKLRTGCVAIGTGVDNVDIGPFGGANPYSPSGISFHPNIWKVTMPTTGTSGGGLQIQVKVNANN